MTSYVPPVKNVSTGWIGYVSLAPRTPTGAWQNNPTLATGDVKISLDGAALANLGTLPAVTPASSKLVKITLSQAETNADNLSIVFSDAAGAEWCDLTVNLQTAARQIDNLAFPTTTGRSIDVTATGGVGIDWANVEAPTTTLNLSGTTISTVTNNVGGNVTGTVASVVGNVGGNVTGSIGSLATQAKTDVNTEVLDVMNADTFAEPGQGAPAATASLVAKIGYLYKSFRNKVTQSSSQFKLYADDASTVDQKASVSDDSTTFTRSEIESGP